MKMTLLEIVQQIHSKLSSDEINSIGDTVESQQVANEVKATYYDMIGNIELPYQYNFVALEPSVDTAKPTHMKVPDNVDNFKWIQYNSGTAAEPDYKEINFLTPEQFILKVSDYKDSNSPLVVQDYSGTYLTVYSDKQPQWYTLFDDVHVVFDSYDSSVDDTLQASKVRAYAQTIPSWTMEDDFIPDLPAKHFPQLLAEAAQACMVYQKQTNSPIDQMRARRQYVRHFNNRNRRLGSEDKVLDFGRKR
jgi:hypothetical protein